MVAASAFRSACLFQKVRGRHAVEDGRATPERPADSRHAPMPFSSLRLDSPLRQAEHTLRRPSTAVWLRRITVQTARFDDALAFYVNGLGLTLGGIDVHPVSSATRARLLDGEGVPVLDLVEADDERATPTAELTFGMPRRTVLLLRARLDGLGVRYTSAGTSLYLADVDGTPLHIESLA